MNSSLLWLLSALSSAAEPEPPSAVVALDAEIVAAQAELDAMLEQSRAPRRSPAELATLEVNHVDARLDEIRSEVHEKKKAIPVAKEKGTRRVIDEAKEALAAAKAEQKRLKGELAAAEDAVRAAEDEGLPAPTQTPEEKAQEELAIELATRRIEVLRARRALALAEVDLETAKAATPPADLAPVEAELAARRADVERLEADLARAEARQP